MQRNSSIKRKYVSYISFFIVYNIIKQLSQKQVSILHQMFSPLSKCYFVASKGLTAKIRMLFRHSNYRSFEPFMCLDLVLEC